MRLFVDTSSPEALRRIKALGFISGNTMNPLQMTKEGTHDVRARLAQMREILGEGEIFSQVVGRTADDMVRQAVELNSWDENLTVKVPVIREGLMVIHRLSEMGIRCCGTLVFDARQAILAAAAGADYVAPFIGRADKARIDGFVMIEDILTAYRAQGIRTEVVAASLITPDDFLRSVKLGAHVITAGPPIYEAMLENPATDMTMEEFLNGWNGDEF